MFFFHSISYSDTETYVIETCLLLDFVSRRQLKLHLQIMIYVFVICIRVYVFYVQIKSSATIRKYFLKFFKKHFELIYQKLVIMDLKNTHSFAHYN